MSNQKQMPPLNEAAYEKRLAVVEHVVTSKGWNNQIAALLATRLNVTRRTIRNLYQEVCRRKSEAAAARNSPEEVGLFWAEFLAARRAAVAEGDLKTALGYFRMEAKLRGLNEGPEVVHQHLHLGADQVNPGADLSLSTSLADAKDAERSDQISALREEAAELMTMLEAAEAPALRVISNEETG